MKARTLVTQRSYYGMDPLSLRAAVDGCDKVVHLVAIRQGREERFRREGREAYDDGWPQPPDDAASDDAPPKLKTTVTIQRSRTIIARNDSPDIPFTRSINPYQGCEHGCIYCYARPTHAYLDLSPGLELKSGELAKPTSTPLKNELKRISQFRQPP